jgi:hypothetical protein
MMGRFSRITRKPEDDAFAMPDAAHDKYIGCEDEEDEEDEHEHEWERIRS